MSEALTIAKLYFDLSNNSEFDGIAKLLTETTTYSSETTGIYLGRDEVLKMQQMFHRRFSSLKWTITSAQEMKSGIILFNFDFEGKLKNSEVIQSSGHEYVVVYKGKIQHIEVRNKLPKLS